MEQKENAVLWLHRYLMLLLVLACRWVKSCMACCALPERVGTGWDLLMATEMLHLCYLRGIAAGAPYLQDCTAVIPFSRKWRCCSVKCKHTKLPPGFEKERIGLFTECVLLLCIVSLGSFLAASSPLLIGTVESTLNCPK